MFSLGCCQGGLVYGLWKPGAEQAEVLAAVLGSPVSSPGSARYHGSDLSTKLKLLGVSLGKQTKLPRRSQLCAGVLKKFEVWS